MKKYKLKKFEQYNDVDPYKEETWDDEEHNIYECSPAGAVFSFTYKDKPYYFLVYVDFENEKVIGNSDIESEQCIVFDGDMNRVDYNDPIYIVVEEYIDQNIVSGNRGGNNFGMFENPPLEWHD